MRQCALVSVTTSALEHSSPTNGNTVNKRKYSSRGASTLTCLSERILPARRRSPAHKCPQTRACDRGLTVLCTVGQYHAVFLGDGAPQLAMVSLGITHVCVQKSVFVVYLRLGQRDFHQVAHSFNSQGQFWG